MALLLPETNWIDITSLFIGDDVQEIDLAGIAGGVPANATSVAIQFTKLIGSNNESHALIKHPSSTQSGHRFSWFYGAVNNAFYPPIKQQVGPLYDTTKIMAQMTMADGAHRAYIVGWFESQDVTFLSETVDFEDVVIGAPADNTFMTLDLADILPAGTEVNGVIARIGVRNTTNTNSNSLYYRPTGSTVASGGVTGSHSYDVILPVNDQGRVDVSLSRTDIQSIAITGYCGPRFKLMSDDLDDALDDYITNTGGYNKHTASYGQDGSTGIPVVGTTTAAGGAYSVRATDDPTATTQYDCSKMVTYFTPLDGSGQFESRSRYGGAGNVNLHAWGVWILSQSTSVSITNVNSTNYVRHNEAIVIRGEGLENCSAKITGKAGAPDIDLVVTDRTEDVLTCAAINVYTTGYMFEDALVEVEDTDKGESDQIAIDILPTNDVLVTTLTSIDTLLITKDLAAAVGDQIVIPAYIGGTQTTLFSDGDVHYDPALPDLNYQGTHHERNWFSVSEGGWEQDEVIIRRTADPGTEPPPEGTAASWRGSFSMPRAMLGVPYVQDISQYATGDAPLFYREVKGELANFGGGIGNTTGVVGMNSNALGTPICQWEVYNEHGADLSNEMPLEIAAIAIYNPVSQNVEVQSAEIAVSTPQHQSDKYVMYWVADPFTGKPTRDQIKAGQNALGAPAAEKGNVAVTNIGQIEWQKMVDSLMSNTEYTYWFVQDIGPS